MLLSQRGLGWPPPGMQRDTEMLTTCKKSRLSAFGQGLCWRREVRASRWELPRCGREQSGCRCPGRVSLGRLEQRERPLHRTQWGPPPAPLPALFLAIAGLWGKINTFPKTGQFFPFDPLFFPREGQPTAAVLRGEDRVAARWPWVQTRVDRCLPA